MQVMHRTAKVYGQVSTGLYSPWALLHKWKYGGISMRRHSPLVKVGGHSPTIRRSREEGSEMSIARKEMQYYHTGVASHGLGKGV